MPVTLTIPYVIDKFVRAINYGNPFILGYPEDIITKLFKDLAFQLSQKEHKKKKPSAPSETWQGVYKRYIARQKNQSRLL